MLIELNQITDASLWQGVGQERRATVVPQTTVF